MRTFEYEKLSDKQIQALGANLEKNNEYITETAGFIPLEVKLKRFQENGQIIQFSSSEFTSSDYRDLYLSEDLEITPEMDIEEIQEIQMKRIEYVKNLMKNKSKVGSSEGTANPPSDSAAANKKSVRSDNGKSYVEDIPIDPIEA